MLKINSFGRRSLQRFKCGKTSGRQIFFIGDQTGGSGWIVADAAGNETKHYIAWMQTLEVWLAFEDAPLF